LLGGTLRHYLILSAAFACTAAAFLACANGGETSTTDNTVTNGDPDATAGLPDSGPAPPSGDDSGGGTNDGGGVDSPAGDSAAGDAAAAADTAPSCVDTDAGCVTGSPGACGAGIQHCQGGVAVCTPIATTQPCYSGAPATQHVGVCKDGTQTCTGTLGTCTGEVVPALVENCFNATDDDCNGVVNNGCPSALALGADRPLPGVGGGGGGGPHVVHCPVGAFVTRVDSYFDDNDAHASGVAIFCATPTLVQGAASYSVTLTPNQPAPYASITGSSARSERSDDCGLVGLTAITYTVGLSDSYVEGLGAHCGTSAVTLKADNTIAFDFVQQGDTSYNAYNPPSGNFFTSGCNPNEVVVGYAARTGTWMDNLQTICAPLTVTYK
jgi:hypothetical protein